MQIIATDVLVIGSGAAGIRAALSASAVGAQIVLLAKQQVGEGGSSFSQVSQGWGIQALVGAERTAENLEAFYDDILRVGLGVCEPELVRILVEESGARFEDLYSYGIQFRKDAAGTFFRAKGCFSDYERAFLAHNLDNIKLSFASILQHSSVRIMKAHAVRLIVQDGCCWGCWFITRSNKLYGINAKATILASGGGAGLFRDNLVSLDDVGEGYALAHQAGAELRNLHFIQFMLGLKHEDSRFFLPLSELSNANVIQDATGSDVLLHAFPSQKERALGLQERFTHMPFSCRDSSRRLDLAVAAAREEGKSLFWTGKTPEILSQHCEVVHFAHAFNGGIKIGTDGQSDLPGLFAAGEVAAGPHGADRIGGCMMTATQVFGQRAGQAAARRVRSMSSSHFPAAAIPEELRWAKGKPSGNLIESTRELEDTIRKAMKEHAGILRSEKGLSACLEILSQGESELQERRARHAISPIRYLLLANMILTGRLVAESALRSKYSLGSHFREDYPIPAGA